MTIFQTVEKAFSQIIGLFVEQEARFQKPLKDWIHLLALTPS
jgi:hypothetical protein